MEDLKVEQLDYYDHGIYQAALTADQSVGLRALTNKLNELIEKHNAVAEILTNMKPSLKYPEASHDNDSTGN